MTETFITEVTVSFKIYILENYPISKLRRDLVATGKKTLTRLYMTKM